MQDEKGNCHRDEKGFDADARLDACRSHVPSFHEDMFLASFLPQDEHCVFMTMIHNGI